MKTLFHILPVFIFMFYVFQIGMEIEVRPGLVSKDSEGKLTCKPIFSRIVSLCAEQNELAFAVPGGLIGTHHVNILKTIITKLYTLYSLFVMIVIID